MATQEVKRTEWRDRYRNGFFLAPMVRVGTLPMRLLAQQYGADLMWGPEIVDKSIVGSERVVDDKTGVIAYVKGGKDIFTTHPREKKQVIFQLGSASPETALAAAKHVEKDVAGFDLNCGCPKRFSIQGGMGAALMADPARLCSILDVLVKNIDLPITCKIRMFDDTEKTLELVRQIAATGISALTVHCRTKDMRPREKAMWDHLKDVVSELPGLPVILNGDIFEFADVERARKETGATSVMTARGAAANPSIFCSEGMLPAMDVVQEYTRLAVRTSNSFINTKYTLLQMYPDVKSTQFRLLQGTRKYKDMCEAMDLAEFYESEGAGLIHSRAEPPDAAGSKKRLAPAAGAATQTTAGAAAAKVPNKRVKA
ncbi:tRNA-dihydrouridine synthase 2 [Coemansia sp. BCRC 34301]|nr:tRNA-dihydrouridine synthase 2 [Coemansia sp. BCRC 34301]